MSLWVDKYRPHDFLKLTYHKEQAAKLEEIVKAGDFPHLLFCGPSGAGKRTRIHCLLRSLYGGSAENTRMDTHEFQTASGKRLQIHVVTSNYHIELTPSDVGMYDRIVVQEIIKEMAEMQQLNRSQQKAYKVVVLMEAENLSKDAQHALRRTMEKYASTCKIILCCESASRIIDPLRSRCMAIRVPAPSDDEIKESVRFVCSKERVNVSREFLEKLTIKSDGNLRRALILLEASYAQYGSDLANQLVVEPEWEIYLKDTAKLIMQRQTSAGILEVRQRFYEMMCRCIPTAVIFVRLVEELIELCDPSLVGDMVAAAAKFEHSSKLGSKEIFHLEAFVATFMDICSRSKILKHK